MDLGQPQRERAAHREAADDDHPRTGRAARGRPCPPRRTSPASRVRPISCHVVPWPGQPGQPDGVPGRRQVLGPGPQAGRVAGEAVAEEYADVVAVVGEGLGSRADGHGRLLVTGLNDGVGRTGARGRRARPWSSGTSRAHPRRPCRNRGTAGYAGRVAGSGAVSSATDRDKPHPSASPAGRRPAIEIKRAKAGRSAGRGGRRRQGLSRVQSLGREEEVGGALLGAEAVSPRTLAAAVLPAVGHAGWRTSRRRAAAILASNHLSFSDSFFLPLVLPRRITFLAKADYFTGRGVKGRLTAGFFRGVGQLPVDRSGGRASRGGAHAPACASSTGASSSGSTPRAPARPTAGSTAARPASRGWRWRPASR